MLKMLQKIFQKIKRIRGDSLEKKDVIDSNISDIDFDFWS